MTKPAHMPRSYPPPLADIEELAYQTGISASTIRLYVKKGWLPAPQKVGNKKIWIMADVMHHIANTQKKEEKGSDTPEYKMDEYEKALGNVAPKKKADDRVA